MQSIILLVIFATTVLALIPQDLLGKYKVGNQCDESPYTCPYTDTLNGKYTLRCPREGKNGFITQLSPTTYQLQLTNMNYAYSDLIFKAEFTEKNIIHNIQGLGQLVIPLKEGYTLNLMPCYFYDQTSEVCSKNKGPNKQLAVWKTNAGGFVCKGCSFSMTWKSNVTKQLDGENYLQEQEKEENYFNQMFTDLLEQFN